MFAILPNILPANRAYINKYIDDVYQDVTTLESSVNYCYINKRLQDKFKSYVKGEEARLEEELKCVRYDIDDLVTVTKVTGTGRIERVCIRSLPGAIAN